MSGRRNGNYPRGENHKEHKLTEANVLEIRKLYKEGVKQEWLARQFGVRQALISKIVNGHTWQLLPV